MTRPGLATSLSRRRPVRKAAPSSPTRTTPRSQPRGNGSATTATGTSCRAAIARPWIGVYYKLVDKQVAKDLGLSVDHGVLINKPASGAPAIFAGSPADKAGLKDGDVIVAVDGDAVDAEHDLSTRILPHVPGDTVSLSVVRDGRTMDISVTLGTLPLQP